MRVLAIDFGSKRIGLAVGEDAHGIASPRAAVRSKEGLQANVATIMDVLLKEQAEAVAVGIPLQEGPESSQARICRKLAELLRQEGVPVFEVDESLTSLSAEERLKAHDWTAAQRDRHKDSEAACLILERYFAEHG